MNGNENALVTMDVGAEVPMVFGSGDTGLEGVDQEMMTLPYLRIVQAGSDIVKRGSPKYLEGIQAGEFAVPLLSMGLGDTIRVVVVKVYRSFTIYSNESSDAKIVGRISAEEFKSTFAPRCHRPKNPSTGKPRSYDIDGEGRRYVDNRNFLVMDYDRPELGMMLFNLSSTGIGPSKGWVTQLVAQKARRPDGTVEDAPIWSSVWELKLGFFQDGGNSWYQLSPVKRMGWVKAGPVAEMYKRAFESVKHFGVENIAGEGDEEDTAPTVATNVGGAEYAHSANQPKPHGAAGVVNSAFGNVAGAAGFVPVKGNEDESTF